MTKKKSNRAERGSLEAAANSYVRYKLHRGGYRLSDRRKKLQENGRKNFSGELLLRILKKQNWESSSEIGSHFYLPSFKASNKIGDSCFILHNNQIKKIAIVQAVESGYIKPSIDRINSSHEYTINNVQLVSETYNKAKRELDNKDFEVWKKRLLIKNTKK